MSGYIDFHTHILPDMDDGPESAEESLEIISGLIAQGVSTIVSTSHFYMNDETIGDFLKRRSSSFDILRKYAENKNFELPKIVLGAEVLFSPLLCDFDCKPLCIENTDCILLEMPYCRFSSMHFKSLDNFLNTSGLQCVLAHIERYYHFNDKEAIYELASRDVLCQINAASIENKKTRSRTLKLIKKGYAHILGSDAHNTSTRPPKFGDAVNILEKRRYSDFLSEMNKTAHEILGI